MTMKLQEKLWQEFLSDNKKIDLSSFELKSSLNKDIWINDNKLRPEIAVKLVEIANNFMKNIGLDDIEIKDIVLTGSLANYNWSQYSDVDLHIMVDFDDIDENEELVREFFRGKSGNWNDRHDIKIRGFEVELYVQDIDEPHVSTGIYSLMNDAWVVKPQKDKPVLDLDTTKKKAQRLIDLIDDIQDLYNKDKLREAYVSSQLMKEKIRKLRKCGLETQAGAYSPENLAFKVLRRNGYLGKLGDLRDNSYDRLMSIEENMRREWHQYLDEAEKSL
jgi:predicted nucleotidyltransferase